MRIQTTPTERGFTLLEILMVIVILSVTTMMVAPSFFSASSSSLEDETHRLVQTLRLAQDEAILSGQSLRITLRQHSYSFQTPNSEGEWNSFNIPPYQAYKLSETIRIIDIQPQPPLSEITSNQDDQEPILAHLLIPAEGIRNISDITLSQTLVDQTSIQRRIQFRPGPGGIRVIKDSE